MRITPQLELLEQRRLLTAYVVDTIADDPAAMDTKDGAVSLREVITAANTNADFGDAPAGEGGGVVDTITFDTLLTGQTIVLGGAELTIVDNLSLTGLGAENLTISGGGVSRVISIDANTTAEISDLTITQGKVFFGFGGGIYNQGTLSVANSVLANNQAPFGGGGVGNEGAATITESTFSNNFSAIRGGGIWNAGELVVSNSNLANNQAPFDGGGVWNQGAATITESAFSKNFGAVGGGICNAGELVVSNSNFTGNLASQVNTNGNGGAIANKNGGSVSIADSVFKENSAGTGGAIDNFGQFPGSFGTLDIAGCLFEGNSSTFTGGAIWSDDPTTISDSVFSGNTAGTFGGAVHIRFDTLTITGSSISGNSATYGGGLDIWGAEVRIVGSTISGNKSGLEGGGIENFVGTLTLTNSTLSGNSTDGVGGGIWNLGEMTVTNSTITGNRADADGDGVGSGGGIFDDGSSVLPLLNNTIVAGNLLGAEGAGSPQDVFGLLAQLSAHNLIGDAATSGGLTDGVSGNIVGNAGAGTIDITTVLDTNLADNGGPTRTHALVAGGLAVDAGDSALAVDAEGNLLSFDQRGSGFARIVGGTVDIGAFEAPLLHIQMQIDVKPGSDGNPINLAAPGVIAVSILTTSDFDASLVDASTVQFAGAYAVHSALEDVDGDGDLDMILQFRVQETNLADVYAALLAEDPDANHQSALVRLEGETINDKLFAGEDFADLFLAGKSLRELLEALALQGML